MADFNISINLRTNTGDSNAVIRQLNRSLNGLGESAGRVGRGRAGAGVQAFGRGMQRLGGAVSDISRRAQNVLTPIIQEGVSFERTMSEVAAFGGTKFIPMLGDMSDKARQLGRDTEFTANDAATSFRIMAQAGREPQQVMEDIKPSLDLAKAGATGLADATSIVVTAMNQFQKEGLAASEVADLIAQTSNTTQSNAAQLGKALSFVGGTSANMNISMQDTLVLLGGLGKTALNSGRAGRNLNAFISKLSDLNRPVVRKAFKGLGIDRKKLRDEMNRGDVLAALTRLRKGFADSGASATQMNSVLVRVFGEQGARAAKALFTAIDTGGLDQVKESLEDSGGAAEKMGNIMADNTAGDIKKAQSAISDLKIEIATQLIPAIRPLIGHVTELTKDFAAWIKENKNVIREWGPLILKLIIAGRVLGPVISGVGGLTRGMGGLVSMLGTVNGKVGGTSVAIKALTGNVGALRGQQLLGAAGFVALAAAAGFAVGTWLDETFGLSDAISGMNRELSVQNELLAQNLSLQIGRSKVRGAALLGSLTDDEKEDLKAAQREKEQLSNELAENAASLFTESDRQLAGFFGSTALGRTDEDITSDIQRAQGRIDKINKAGLERERKQLDQSVGPKALAAQTAQTRAQAKANAEELAKLLNEPRGEIGVQIITTDPSPKVKGANVSQSAGAGVSTEGL